MADRTWQQDLGRASMDASSVANNALSYEWYQVQALTGNVGGFTGTGLWTMYYSCDSVNAGTAGDGVNRWSPLGFDAAKLVRATSGAHSWAVLRSPAGFGGNGPYYLIIDLVGSSAQTPSKLYYCKAAPTGGTTSARPTSTDETSAITIQNVENAIALWRFHGILSNTGDFLFTASKNTSGYMWTANMAVAPVNPASNLSFRLFAYKCYASAFPGALSVDNFCSMSSLGWFGRKFNNSGTFGPFVAIPAAVGGQNIFASMPIGGSYFVAGSAPSVPAVLCSIDTGYVDYIGALPDMSIGPQSFNGKATPVGGPYTHVQLGALSAPMTSIPSM